MLIIIEGPDGAGKSTLAHALVRDYGYGYVHFSQPKQDPLLEYLPAWTHEDKLVVDRFHLGEGVYGPLYRGKDGLGPLSRWYVDQWLESRGAVLVLKTADVDTLVKRCERRGEDYLQMVDMPKVVEAFDTQLEASVVSNKMRNPTPKQVNDRAYHRQSLWRPLKVFPTYLGRRYPGVLLVGDTPESPSGKSVLPHVPFAPLPNSCGRWMWEALYLDPEFRRVGCINSANVDLQRLYRALGTPRVVALGNMASARLQEQGVPHGMVPHPQYAKRFHYRSQAAYRMIIKQAAQWQQKITEVA